MSAAHPISQLRYRFGVVAVVAAAAIAVVGLLGAAFGHPVLASFGHGLPPMKSSVAVGLAAASAGWLGVHSASPRIRMAGLGLAAFAGLLALAMLAQHVLGVDLGIDEALMRATATLAEGHPGRAPVAVCLALLCAAVAIALTVSAASLAEDARQIIRLVGLTISLFAVALYLTEPQTLRVIDGFETFALTTALALALLFLAISFDRSSASLRWQIAHLGVVVIAPLVALTVHFASSEREIALSNASYRLAGVARLGVERQDAVIEEMRKTLMFLARSADVRGATAACGDQLKTYSNLNAATRTMYVMDSAGIVRCSDLGPLVGESLADREYVQEALAAQAFTVSSMFVTRVSRLPRIACALPVQLPGGRTVLLAAGLDLGAFGDTLELLAKDAGPGATMTLVDSRGVVIARHPKNLALVGLSAADATFVTEALATPDSYFEAAEMDGEATVFAARRQRFGEGTLIVGLPKRQVVAPVDERMNGRLAVICALLLGSIALGTLGGEGLVLRPLRRLTAYAGRLEAGDLGARPEVSARGEVGALGRALAVMAAAVEDREQRLAGAEALFRSLFDHSPDSAVVMRVAADNKFRVETWNMAAQHATGLSAGDVVGRSPQEVFPGGRGERIARDLENARDLGRVLKIEREPVINGAPVTYEMVLAPLRDANGRIERIFLSARDISERRRMERMKNEFVSTVSHELRTPLTSIAGSLGLLAGGAAGALGDKATHLITIAHSNSLRLVRLINDILDIEKIESGGMAFELTPLSAVELLTQATGALRPYADEFGVILEISPGGEDLMVRGDADRLTQVITNLVSNAIKFSPRGGVVTISATAEQDVVTLAVRDRGPGIPVAFRPRMFSKFAQADGSDSRRKGGTGLGLAIVKEIVERHAGAVSYETALGEGTEFQVRLPRYRRRDEDASPFAPETERPRVLICEDDPFIATILSELLKDEGFDSITVGTVRDARAAAAEGGVEAILVDLHLPDGDGISLIRDLQTAPGTRSTPIVVVSAAAERGRDDARAAMLDVVAWLDKPVDASRLAAVLRERLGSAPSRPSILHVEDDPDLCHVVSAAVSSFADVVSVGSLQAAREELRQRAFDLAIIDVTLEDGSGLDLLVTLERQSSGPIPAVIFSAHDIDRDIAAKVAGALTKSRTSLTSLVEAVRSVVAERRPVSKAG